MNFDILIPEFKRFCIQEKGIQPKSYQTIAKHMQLCLLFIAKKNIRSIYSADIQRYLYHQAESKNWSPKTFRNHLQSISSFFDWALRKHYVSKNPCKSIQKPKLPKPLPRYLTEIQAQKILDAIQRMNWTSKFMAIRNYTIITTFLQTGLRLNELIKLELEDLDMDILTIKVRKGKGNKMRLIPIHPTLQITLKQYLVLRLKREQGTNLLFPSVQKNCSLHPKTVQAICLKISIYSGIKFTPHMLRHTFGRSCTDQNLPFFKLKELMGHSSILTTQRYASISMQGLKNSFYQMQF